jgi:hypothetical protein
MEHNDMHQEHSSLLHPNLQQYYFLNNPNPKPQYLALLPSFIHPLPLLSIVAILKKVATLHPNNLVHQLGS